MYENAPTQPGYSIGSRLDQPMPVPVGLHLQLSDLTKRIYASIATSEKLLNRVLGPRPTEEGKTSQDARESTTLELVQECHSLMGRLETRLAGLGNAIS